MSDDNPTIILECDRCPTGYHEIVTTRKEMEKLLGIVMAE